MALYCLKLFFLFSVLLLNGGGLQASPGNADPIYKYSSVKRLDVFRISASRTANSQPRKPLNSPWYFQEPLFLKWKEWGCRSDCRYHCMLAREQEKQKLGNKPVKYHGKWPFQRVLEIQNSVYLPVEQDCAVAQLSQLIFSGLIQIGQKFVQWSNSWSRFAVLNMVVVSAMVAVQYLFWAIWAGLARHPSHWKIWALNMGGVLAILLEIYDFLLYKGLVDVGV